MFLFVCLFWWEVQPFQNILVCTNHKLKFSGEKKSEVWKLLTRCYTITSSALDQSTAYFALCQGFDSLFFKSAVSK